MKHLSIVPVALALTAFLPSSALTRAQERTGPDQAILGSQPNFVASVRMKVPKCDCLVEYGTLARVDDKARVDIRPVFGKRRQIDCSPGPPIYGVMFPIGERFWSDKITVLDHTKRTYDDSRDERGVPAMAPYSLMMGWMESGTVSDRGKHVEGERILNGHPCVVISDRKTGEQPWIRYYVARDLKNLVIRIEWWSGGGGVPAQLKLENGARCRSLPPSGGHYATKAATTSYG